MKTGSHLVWKSNYAHLAMKKWNLQMEMGDIGLGYPQVPESLSYLISPLP